jgi:tetratricopeptide (TPR) repeat protein
MNLFKWRIWPRSVRGEVTSLYKEGMARAEKQDVNGAMAAYTSAIETADAPDDIKAMALYNRALLFAAQGKTELALADLKIVLDLPIPQRDVKLAARRRVDGLQHRLAAAARVNRPATS